MLKAIKLFVSVSPYKSAAPNKNRLSSGRAPHRIKRQITPQTIKFVIDHGSGTTACRHNAAFIPNTNPALAPPATRIISAYGNSPALSAPPRETISAITPQASAPAIAEASATLQPIVPIGSAFAKAHPKIVQTGNPVGHATPPYIALVAAQPSFLRPRSGVSVPR